MIKSVFKGNRARVGEFYGIFRQSQRKESQFMLTVIIGVVALAGGFAGGLLYRKKISEKGIIIGDFTNHFAITICYSTSFRPLAMKIPPRCADNLHKPLFQQLSNRILFVELLTPRFV